MNIDNQSEICEPIVEHSDDLQCNWQYDIETISRRFDAWWHGEIIDRPPVTLNIKPYAISCCPPEPNGHSFDPANHKWLDAEFILDNFEANLDGATFMAENLPCFLPNLGPDLCATVFGAQLQFACHTSWSRPVVTSCRQVPDLKADLDNLYWSTIRKMTAMSLERSNGRWMTSLPDLHTNGDLLASLVGPQNLCLEMAQDIDSVCQAMEYLDGYYASMYDDLWLLIEATGQTCVTWVPALHRGRVYPVSCDFICMISPEMLDRTIIKSIEYEINYLDRSIFHLDGPGALVHLDRLLDIPNLNGIQWVYGAGQEPADRWIDVYKRIQAAGKCIQLITEDLTDAMNVAQYLDPRGVWFCPQGMYSSEEAAAFIQQVENWSTNKKG